MKITKIVQQVKQTGRYSIFVEGAYAFSLGESALLESKLTSGQELTKAELQNWKKQSADDKIAAHVLQFAAMRPRSMWEVKSYLERKKASPSLTKKILNKLTNSNLLDDESFTRSWVSTRRLLRPTSKRKLQQELRTKHVSDEVVERVLADEATDERLVLQELITKKRAQTKYKNDDLKLMQYLARQGFNYGDIKAAMGR